MIEQIQSEIQRRLDQLLDEADRLRRALAALGGHDGAARGRGTRAQARSETPSKRARGGSGSRSSRSTGARSTGNGKAPAPRRAAAASASASSERARTAPGQTKSAVLAALANGEAMTAGKVAEATGLGRATVSTTLSKLAKSGEVTKARRGYQLSSTSSS